jgi:hypothetical protein
MSRQRYYTGEKRNHNVKRERERERAIVRSK